MRLIANEETIHKLFSRGLESSLGIQGEEIKPFEGYTVPPALGISPNPFPIPLS